MAQTIPVDRRKGPRRQVRCPERAVPANAVELLRDSIKARKDGSITTEGIRQAVALICESAHRDGVNPEGLIVTIKEICHALPEYDRIRDARERDGFVQVVVTAAIEEYYRA